MLTLIGSGETSDRLLNLHHASMARLQQPPRLAFIETPAAFQLNTAEIAASFRNYFQKNFALELTVIKQAAPDLPLLQQANYILSGPGSPTYAIRNWSGTLLYQTLVERLNADAQIVLASSAAIAVSRYALPVYEIYKAGRDPYWVAGLDLLQPYGLELAIIPHYDNKEGRTYDTRYCFMGEPRFTALEKMLPGSAVILGIDENTACTFEFESKLITVVGAGRVTIRYQGIERHYREGDSFPFERLTPAHAGEAEVGSEKLEVGGRKLEVGSVASPALLYVSPKVKEWNEERNRLRAEKKFAESDGLRSRLAAVGYAVKDTPQGAAFSLTRYAKPAQVPSQLETPATLDWSVQLLAHNNRAEIIRAAQSVLRWGAGHALEVVMVDNGSTDDTLEGIVDLACEDERVRPIFMETDLGEGAGRNAGFRASHGQHLMILGGHMEITGEVFAPLAAALADERVGATGSHGLTSADLFTFAPAATPQADAIEFYLFACKRERLHQVGLLDEKFVFYRNIDLDWSLAFKEKGLRLLTTPGLPLQVHEHPYLRMDPDERDKLSKKNYRRFLEKWRERKDLLLVNRSPSL